MKIYNKNGVEILDVNVSDESYRYRTIMGDNSVTLMFSLFEYIEIEIDSYIDYQGEIYTLRKPQIPVMNDTENFDYTALFESAGSLLSKYKFRDYSNRLKFSMTGKPLDFIQAVVHNLNLRDSGWTVGTCIDAVEKTLSFNHTYLNDVIRQVAESFKTEFEIVGKQINLKKLEYNKSNPLALSYGRGNGFKSGIKRDNVGNSKAFEILFIQGGEKNINASKYGSPELLLPKLQSIKYDGSKFEGEEGYISQNSREYISDSLGLSIQRNRALSTKVEDSVDLSNIYPSRVGSVSTVVVVNSDKNYYDITDSSIPDALDYDDCLIAGETMTIIFQSGMLAGREFDCNYNHSARKFEIVPAELDGISMPGGVYVPSVGDKYAIFGIQLPDAYFCDNTTKTGSSWELFKEAVKYFYDNEDEKFSFTGMLDPIWAASDWVNIGGKIVLGGFISFTAEFQQTPVLIRITGIKDFVNFPHKPEIELSNVTSGGGYGSSLKDIPNTETVIQDSKKEVVRFAKRGFRDAQETASMLQNSLLNFSGSISPITVQTMQLLVGDESLQFEFVANQNSTTPIPHSESYNPSIKKFTSAAGIIQHRSIGITSISSSHSASEYKWWSMAEYISAVLDESDKSYYLYAKCSKTENTGVFLLSETAISMEHVEGYYHLLVGILNSERDSDRSYSPLYGYSELTPGRLTIKKIVSPSGNVYFDMDKGNGDGEIGGNIKFRSSSGALKDVQTGLTETQTAAATDATTKASAAQAAAIQAAQQDASNKVNAIQIGGVNLLLNSETGLFSQYNVGGDYDEDVYEENGNKIHKITCNADGTGFFRAGIGGEETRKINDIFTISFYAKCSRERDFYGIGLESGGQFGGHLTTEFAKFEYTFTQTTPINYSALTFYCGWQNGDEFYIHSFQIERGNKATTYKKNDADIKAEIDANKSYIDTIKSDLQNQIDGVVDSWFFPYTPALDNEPASLWTDDTQRGRHVGDTFTSTQVFVSNDQTPDAGKSWRWAYTNGVYHWTPIADSDAVKALLAASKAQDTADNKKRVFTVQPFTPYDEGDLWAQGANGDFMKCDVSRATGAFVASDWSKSSKYTDDTAVNNLQIGGANLAKNTDFRFGWDGWGTNVIPTGNRTIETSSPTLLSKRYVKWINVANGGSGIYYYTVHDFEDGKKYKMSFYAKADQNVVLNAWFEGLQGYQCQLTTQWQKFEVSCVGDGSAHAITFYNGSGTVNTMYLSELMLVEGDKAMSWKLSDIDISTDIATAKQAADDAQSAADDAQTAATNLNNYVVGAFRDGVIDESEKKAIKEHQNVVESIFSPLDNAYTVLVQNSYLEGTAKTELIQAKVSLNGCRSDIINAILAIVNAPQTVSDALYDYYSDRYSDFQGAVSDFNLYAERANKAIQAKLDALSTEKVEAVKIADDNLLSGSRFSTTTGWTVDGGTVSAVDEPVFGEKVVEIVRTAQGNFQFGFSYNWSTLNSKDVIFYVIAKQIESGAWNFGGWSETYNTLNNNSSYRELEGGYRLYYARVNVATVCSGGTLGLNSITGKWRFYACGVALGNTPPAMWTSSKTEQAVKAAAAKVLSDAIAQTTEIDGGLALLTALLTRYNNVVSAGIMAKTATNNIAIFGGGTVEEAIAKTSKFGVTHDGDAWLRGFIEATSGKIGGLNISNNSLISESMSFSESPVETLAELLNPQTYSISEESTWNVSTQTGGEDEASGALAYTQNLVLPIDCKLQFRATCIPDGLGAAELLEDKRYRIYVVKSDGTTVYYKSGKGSIFAYTVSLNLPAGTYKIYASAISTISSGDITTNSAQIEGVNNSSVIVATGFVNKSKIGNNGMFSFWDVLNFLYYSKEEGLKVRGGADVPMLGGGTSYLNGGVVYKWGRVSNGSRSGNTTTVTHSAGSTNEYSVILTAYGNNMPYISDKGTNTLSIYCAGSFDFVLIRTI